MQDALRSLPVNGHATVSQSAARSSLQYTQCRCIQFLNIIQVELACDHDRVGKRYCAWQYGVRTSLTQLRRQRLCRGYHAVRGLGV